MPRLWKRIDTSKKEKTPIDGVYFLTSVATGMTKIGYSVDVRTRLARIVTGCPDRYLECFVVKSDGTVTEADMHKEFDRFRSHGEWFRLSQKKLEKLRNDHKDRVVTIDLQPLGWVDRSGGKVFPDPHQFFDDQMQGLKSVRDEEPSQEMLAVVGKPAGKVVELSRTVDFQPRAQEAQELETLRKATEGLWD